MRALRFFSCLAVWMLSIGVASVASASPSSGDLMVWTGSSCCSSTVAPDMYQLDSTGDFKGLFFSPVSPSDIAVDHTGRVLFASTNSGNIVTTDERGGYLGTISTPMTSIEGLAVAADGTLVATRGQDIYHLSSTGSLLDIVFSPVAISSFSGGVSIGMLGNDELAFQASSSSSSTLSINFLNLSTRSIRTVSTSLRSITALDVAENGQMFVIGSDQSCCSSSNQIFRLGPDGQSLSKFGGPTGMSRIAIANLPEPGTGLLLSMGLCGLAARRGARREGR